MDILDRVTNVKPLVLHWCSTGAPLKFSVPCVSAKYAKVSECTGAECWQETDFGLENEIFEIFESKTRHGQ